MTGQLRPKRVISGAVGMLGAALATLVVLFSGAHPDFRYILAGLSAALVAVGAFITLWWASPDDVCEEMAEFAGKCLSYLGAAPGVSLLVLSFVPPPPPADSPATSGEAAGLATQIALASNEQARALAAFEAAVHPLLYGAAAGGALAIIALFLARFAARRTTRAQKAATKTPTPLLSNESDAAPGHDFQLTFREALFLLLLTAVRSTLSSRAK